MSVDVSVIVPTYNKRQALELTLAAFNHQSFSADRFEVIVVDDGSTDDTGSFVRSYDTTYRLVYIPQENAGRSVARNSGIRKAAGNVIIFSDAEAIPSREFVEHHYTQHLNNDVVVLGQKYDALSEWELGMPTSWLDMLELRSSHVERTLCKIREARVTGEATFLTRLDIESNPDSVWDVVFRKAPHNGDKIFDRYSAEMTGFTVPWIIFVTVNASILKKKLEQLGGFDESFSGWGMEDIELGYRLHKSGSRFVYAEGATNFHQAHRIDPVIRQKDQGRNFGLFCEKHPALEVLLFWRFTRGRLSFELFSDIIDEYYSTAGNKPSTLFSDYLEHSKKLAEEYVLLSRFPQFIP
jgi:glycosyltransferase involved in cell wall biosynthesis